MSKLRIYACSGVGDTKQEQPTTLFTTEGTNAITNTQAMNKLLSLINMCAADSQLLTTTPEDRAKCYQDMDIYSVCFHFARLYAGDNEKLKEAGYAISKYLEIGKFNINSNNLEAHGARVDELIDGIQGLIDSGDCEAKDSAFMQWWNKDIMPYNKVGLNQEQQARARKVAAKRRGSVSGWQDNEDLNKYLNDGGTYFIYTYFTEEQLKQLPVMFRIKKDKQQEVYNYCLEAFSPIYGTEEDMRRIIATSIKNKFHISPERLRDKIASGDIKVDGDSIGCGISDIISAIATLISVLVSLLAIILQYCAAVAAAKYTVPEDPDAGIATTDDFADWSPKRKEKLWMLLIGGIAALLLLKE